MYIHELSHLHVHMIYIHARGKIRRTISNKMKRAIYENAPHEILDQSDSTSYQNI